MADEQDGSASGVSAYVAKQMRFVEDALAQPHMLIRGDGDEDVYFVTVASVAGLDTALAASGIAAGRLVAHVLPTVTLSDCQVIKRAVVAGDYRGLLFDLLVTPEGDDPVAAKLDSIPGVIEARRDIDAAAANLAALAERLWGFGRISQGTRARPESRPGAATRASLGAEQWEHHVNRFIKTDVPPRLEYAADRLRSIGAVVSLPLPKWTVRNQE